MLTIVGTGIRRPQQLTLEGVAALRGARRVLHLTATEGEIDAMLVELGVSDSRSLEGLYVAGAVDDENYERICRAVCEEVGQGGSVVLLLYGHPRVGVTLTAMLERRLDAVTVVPAPSSFDTMINDLRRDPLQMGSVLVDANRLLLFEFHLEPCLDHYIFHADAVATRQTHHTAGNGSRFDLLQAYLLRFFPAEHQVTVIASGVSLGAPALQQSVALGELERAGAALSDGASIFVPGSKPKHVNRAVYEALRASAPAAAE